MPRTPIFSALAESLHLVRRARASGTPLRELADQVVEQRAMRLSRRALIQAAGAVAAGLCLPGLTAADPVGNVRRPRIAILGGGIAGLACAHRLRQRGYTATIYDAATRLGGRMFSDRTTFANQGQVCELGGEFLDTSHVTMRRLAKQLGLKLEDKRQDQAAGLTDLVGYFAGRHVPYAELLTGFAPIAAAIDRDLATMTDANGWPDYTDGNGAEWLDAQSIRGWLDANGFRGPARDLVEVAYVIEWGLDGEASNALNLLGLISTNTKRIEIFGASDERFHVVGGNDQIPIGLAKPLSANIRTGWRLEAASQRSDGAYALAFQVGDGAREIIADHVVCTLPFTILRQLPLRLDLPAVKRRAIAELGYGQNTKLMLGTASRPWRAQGSDGQSFSDLGYQNSWDTAQMQAGAAGILTEYTGGSEAIRAGDGSAAARAARFAAQIDRVYPGTAAAVNGRRVRMAWDRQPFARASYAAYLVGQYTTISGAEAFPVGQFYFAGEHTGGDDQGYMEGGAASGERAADEVIAALLPIAAT